MATEKQREYALVKSIELTGKALESSSSCNPISDPEGAAEFIDVVYKKLVELQEEG